MLETTAKRNVILIIGERGYWSEFSLKTKFWLPRKIAQAKDIWTAAAAYSTKHDSIFVLTHPRIDDKRDHLLPLPIEMLRFNTTGELRERKSLPLPYGEWCQGTEAYSRIPIQLIAVDDYLVIISAPTRYGNDLAAHESFMFLYEFEANRLRLTWRSSFAP